MAVLIRYLVYLDTWSLGQNASNNSWALQPKILKPVEHETRVPVRLSFKYRTEALHVIQKPLDSYPSPCGNTVVEAHGPYPSHLRAQRWTLIYSASPKPSVKSKCLRFKLMPCARCTSHRCYSGPSGIEVKAPSQPTKSLLQGSGEGAGSFVEDGFLLWGLVW